jgi:hypothetical protein
MARKKSSVIKELFIVLTFGVGSTLVRGMALTRKEVNRFVRPIRESGGAPKVYRCRLVK